MSSDDSGVDKLKEILEKRRKMSEASRKGDPGSDVEEFVSNKAVKRKTSRIYSDGEEEDKAKTEEAGEAPKKQSDDARPTKKQKTDSPKKKKPKGDSGSGEDDEIDGGEKDQDYQPDKDGSSSSEGSDDELVSEVDEDGSSDEERPGSGGHNRLSAAENLATLQKIRAAVCSELLDLLDIEDIGLTSENWKGLGRVLDEFTDDEFSERCKSMAREKRSKSKSKSKSS